MDTLRQIYISLFDITRNRIREASKIIMDCLKNGTSSSFIQTITHPDPLVLENALAHYCLLATQGYYRCLVALKKTPLVQIGYTFWKDLQTYFGIFWNIPKENPLRFQNSTHLLFEVHNAYEYEEVIKDAIEPEQPISDKEKQYLLTINYMDSLQLYLGKKELRDVLVVIQDNEIQENRNPLPKKTFVYICNNIENNPDINKMPSKVKFLYIEYRNEETGENVEIHLDPEYYYSGNQLFSPAFVYQRLKKRAAAHKFHMNYTIYLVDHKIEALSLKNTEYLQLYQDSWKIVGS